MKILACDGIHADGLTLFKEAGFEVEISDPIKDVAVLAEKLKDFDGIMVRSATLISAEALEKAKHLKVIGRAGAGVDTIDVEAATARGIAVMNAPGRQYAGRRRTRGFAVVRTGAAYPARRCRHESR